MEQRLATSRMTKRSLSDYHLAVCCGCASPESSNIVDDHRYKSVLLMAWLITFSPLLYILGAVAFWLFHKSGSLKRDFLLGLAWPIAVPVIVPLSIGRRIGALLKERRARLVQEQAKRESELQAQEQRFIGYAAQDTPKWMTDEVREG